MLLFMRTFSILVLIVIFTISGAYILNTHTFTRKSAVQRMAPLDIVLETPEHHDSHTEKTLKSNIQQSKIHKTKAMTRMTTTVTTSTRSKNTTVKTAMPVNNTRTKKEKAPSLVAVTYPPPAPSMKKTVPTLVTDKPDNATQSQQDTVNNTINDGTQNQQEQPNQNTQDPISPANQTVYDNTQDQLDPVDQTFYGGNNNTAAPTNIIIDDGTGDQKTTDDQPTSDVINPIIKPDTDPNQQILDQQREWMVANLGVIDSQLPTSYAPPIRGYAGTTDPISNLDGSEVISYDNTNTGTDYSIRYVVANGVLYTEMEGNVPKELVPPGMSG